MSREGGLRIGEVARLAGVHIETLRYYERRKLLTVPPRTGSGYRQYPAEAVRVVRFIKRAQEIGFTLAEVRSLLQLRTGGTNRRGSMRRVALKKLDDIDRRIRDLGAVREALQELVVTCDCEDDAETAYCPILEALEEKAPPTS